MVAVSAFKSNLVRSAIDYLGAEHKLTIAYSKEQNAIVGGQNKEVLRHLRSIIFDKRVTTNGLSTYLLFKELLTHLLINQLE